MTTHELSLDPTHRHTHTTACWWHPTEARWECRPVAAAAPAEEPPAVDVRDMLVVHTALLREFRLAPAAVLRVPEGDLRQARAVAEHLGFVAELLHHHHSGEDRMLWPTLRERLPEQELAVLDTVEQQHAGIDEVLGEVTALLTAWGEAPTTAAGAPLAERLRALHALLAAHLDLEERLVLPLVAVTLTPAEWGAVGEAAVAALPKPVLPLVFGLFSYEGDPVVLRAMLSSAPALPRMVLPRVAPRVYARRARKVHGTARP